MAAAQPGVYTPRENAQEALPRRVGLRAPDTSTSSGIANIGTAISGVADAMQTKAKADGTTQANDALTDLRVSTQQAYINAQNTAKDGAQGFTNDVLTEFDKNAAGMDKIDNPYAKKAIQAGIKQIRGNLAETSMGWEAQQGVQYRADSVQKNTQKLSAVVENDPSQYKVSVEQQLLTLQGSNLPPSVRLKLANDTSDTLTKAAARGLVKQDPQSVLDQLHNPNKAGDIIGSVDPNYRPALEQAANHQLAQNASDAVVSTYRDQGATAGQSAYAAIDKMKATDEVKEATRRQVQSGISELKSQRTQQYGNQIEGLEQRISSGKPQDTDSALIHNLYQKGVYSASEAGSAIGHLQKAQEKQVDDEALQTAVEDAYKNGTPLDPKDKDTKDAVDSLFLKSTQGLQPGSQLYLNRATDIAARTGVIPNTLASWSRMQIVSGNPKDAASAAIGLSNAMKASPRGAPYAIDGQTKAMTLQITDAVTAGADAVQAVELARHNATLPDGELKALDQRYTKAKVAGLASLDIANFYKKNVPGAQEGFLFKSVPDIPPGMSTEYTTLLHDYYRYTGGNVDQAKKLALNDIQTKWGVSTVNGKREFMYYSPEQQGYDTKIVRDDLEASVKGRVDDPTKIQLVPNELTESSGGKQFAVTAPDKLGALDIVRDSTGHPLVYQLPDAQAAFDAKRKEEADKGIAKLKTSIEINNQIRKSINDQSAYSTPGM